MPDLVLHTSPVRDDPPHPAEATITAIDVVTDLKAEAAILGSVLLDNGHMDEVSRRLEEGDLWSEQHRIILRAMRALHPGPIDTVTLCGWLTSEGLRKHAGGSHYIATLTSETPAACHVQRYVDRVLELSAYRRLRDVARFVLHEMEAPGQGPEFAERIEGMLSRATQPLRRQGATNTGLWSPSKLRQAIEAEAAEARAKGRDAGRISFGLPEWDEAVEIPRGMPVILGAYPGVGKSLITLTLGLAAARQGHRVRIFKLEDTAKSEWVRAVAQLTGMWLSRVKAAFRDGPTNPDWHVCRSAEIELERLPIQWGDSPAVQVDQLCMEIRQAARDGVELVEVDHMGEVLAPSFLRNRGRHDEVAYIAKALRNVGRETGIALILVCHLNEQGEPAESKWVGRSARVVITVRNPEQALEEGKRQAGDHPWPLEAEITKANHGRTGGVIGLTCDPTCGQIRARSPIERMALERARTQGKRMWQCLPHPNDPPHPADPW